MPIGGVVITCHPGDATDLQNKLARLRPHVEIHGTDNAGNIVAVLETPTTKAMESLIDQLNRQPAILHVGLTYLNFEDEMEQRDGRTGDSGQVP